MNQSYTMMHGKQKKKKKNHQGFKDHLKQSIWDVMSSVTTEPHHAMSILA
jgi:flagellar hook-basal body complex protein FliE